MIDADAVAIAEMADRGAASFDEGKDWKDSKAAKDLSLRFAREILLIPRHILRLNVGLRTTETSRQIQFGELRTLVLTRIKLLTRIRTPYYCNTDLRPPSLSSILSLET